MEDNCLFYLDELDLKGIVKDLLRNLWAIILAMLSAILLSTSFFALKVGEKYTSSATIAIINNSSSTQYAGLSTSTSMAEALSNVFKSRILQNKLKNELGHEPVGKLDVSLISNTNLVSLEMTASNSGDAYRELQLLLENYNQFSDHIFSNAELFILSEPSIPLKPSNEKSVIVYNALASFIAFVLCTVFIVFNSVMRRTVKNKLSATRWIHADILGTIIYEEKNKTLKHKLKKSNKSILITNPTCSMLFEESFNRLVSSVIYSMEKNRQQILLVTSTMENEGKSTIASNLALAMEKRGKKVLLIDMDFRKPALYKIFGYNTENSDFYSLNDYLNDKQIEKIPNLLRKDKMTGLMLALNKGRVVSEESVISSEGLKEFLEYMRRQVDYIIFDCSPVGVAGDAELLIELSDTSLVVIRRDYVYIEDINYSLELLKNSGTEVMGCVLNDMYSNNSEKELKKSGYYGYIQKTEKYSKF